MNKLKISKILANIIYGIGVAIFVALFLMYIFGADYIPNPEAMLPSTLSEIAFICAAVGALPLMGISMAVYRLNDINKHANKKVYRAIIFFPGLVCSGCFLFIVGVIVVMYIQGLMAHISFMQSERAY